MKKFFLLVAVCALLTGLVFSAEKPEIDLHVGYSFGLGSFYDSLRVTLPDNVRDFRNWPGISFRLGGYVPLALGGRLAAVPDITLQYGNQSITTVSTIAGSSDARSQRYFRQFGAGLSVAYSYLRPGNGWNLYALSGFFTRHVSGDGAAVFAKNNYLGWQAGLGFRFRQTRRWGFSSQAVYQVLFGSEKNSSLAVQGGVAYSF